jgi:hypothetical protein
VPVTSKEQIINKSDILLFFGLFIVVGCVSSDSYKIISIFYISVCKKENREKKKKI